MIKTDVKFKTQMMRAAQITVNDFAKKAFDKEIISEIETVETLLAGLCRDTGRIELITINCRHRCLSFCPRRGEVLIPRDTRCKEETIRKEPSLKSRTNLDNKDLEDLATFYVRAVRLLCDFVEPDVEDFEEDE